MGQSDLSDSSGYGSRLPRIRIVGPSLSRIGNTVVADRVGAASAAGTTSLYGTNGRSHMAIGCVIHLAWSEGM